MDGWCLDLSRVIVKIVKVFANIVKVVKVIAKIIKIVKVIAKIVKVSPRPSRWSSETLGRVTISILDKRQQEYDPSSLSSRLWRKE